KPEPQPPSRPVTQNVSATASVQQTAQTKPPVFAQTSMVTDTAVKPCNADAPLALKGYCPVCMITKAQLVEGDVSTCVTYAGHRYVFRTVEEKKQFEAEPRKYLPGADGVCLVTLMDSGKVTLGSVEWPAIFEDKVYLFADSANRRKFLEDPEKYVNSWQQASHTQPTLR